MVNEIKEKARTHTHTTSTSKARARRVACREGGGGGGGGSCNPEEIQLLLLPVPPLRRHLRPSTPEANAAAQRRQRVSGSEAEGQREVATAIDELFARAGFLVGGVGTQKKGNGFVSGEFSGLDMAGAPRR